MAEKIVIAELDIDTGALIKSTQQLKSSIDNLKKSQKELTKEGETASAEYVQNVADLKALSTAYNSNIKAIADSTKAKADEANRTELLNLAINTEVTSIKEAREQNSLLNRLRNEANATTADGQAEILKLNEALDSNNEFIEENADAYLKQKINIGNYKDSIVEAMEELSENKKALEKEKEALMELRSESEKGSEQWSYYNNEINQTNTQINVLITSMGGMNDEANASASITKILSGDFKGLANDAKEAGGGTALLSSSVKGATKSMTGLLKSIGMFLISPIGIVVSVLAGAFALVKNAMERSEESTNKITKLFSVFTGIVNKVLSALEPLGEYLIDGLVMGFEAVGKVAEKTMGLLADALEFIGFDEASNSVKGFTNEIKEASKASQDLADKEALLEKQQRKTQLIQLQYQKRAEELRQIRDAENVQIKDRIKANEDLGVVLQKQLTEELKIAKLALEVANVKIQQEGEKKELLDAQYEALTRIADIEERVTGQQSEQLVNRNSLIRDATTKANEQADKRISKLEEELAYTVEKRRLEEESVSELQILADAEIKVLDEKLRLKKISQTAYNTEVLKLQNDLTEAQLEQEQAELERIKEFESTKLDLENELALARETDEIAKAELKLEQEYQAHLLELENLELQANERLELEKLLLEQRNIALAEINSGNFEAEIEKKAEMAQIELDADKARTDALTSNAQGVADTLSSVLGDSIEARLAGVVLEGALAVAQIKSNTAQANAQVVANTQIANAKALAASPLTGGLPWVAFNTANQIKSIASNNLASGIGIAKVLASSTVKAAKFEKGGIQESGGFSTIGGKDHSQGGTKFYGEDGTVFEAQRDEGIGILNRSAYSSFMDFNNRFGSGSSSSGFLEGGGIITQGVRNDTQNLDGIIEAIASQPAPIVAVEEIQRVGSQFISVKDMANL